MLPTMLMMLIIIMMLHMHDIYIYCISGDDGDFPFVVVNLEIRLVFASGENFVMRLNLILIISVCRKIEREPSNESEIEVKNLLIWKIC